MKKIKDLKILNNKKHLFLVLGWGSIGLYCIMATYFVVMLIYPLISPDSEYTGILDFVAFLSSTIIWGGLCSIGIHTLLELFEIKL